MKFELATLVAAITTSAVAGGAVELTKSNFKSKMQGKNAFVKFLAPWCGHCKSMAADWHKLGDSYADSSVLIGDVDCTASGDELCQDFQVQGYPTIKYFVDGDEVGQDYHGPRNFEGLKEFAEAELEVKCLLSDTSLCTEKELKYIEKMKGKSASERAAQTKRLEGMMGNSMKAELKAWMGQRLRILRQFESGGGDDEF